MKEECLICKAPLEYLENNVPSTDSNLWFDITGRTYNSKPTVPGIYINSGQKYIIK